MKGSGGTGSSNSSIGAGATSSMAQAAAFHRANTAMATPNNIYNVSNNEGVARHVVKNVNFPVQLGSSDPDDVRYAIQKNLVNEGGVVENVGQAIVGPEYFDYVTRKMEDAEYVMFQDWLMKQADWSTPEKTEYWVTRFPWMLEKRLNEVDRVVGLQRQMAKINITGPQAEEDWKLLWNINRGLVKIPAHAVQNLPQDTTYTTNTYQQGMFSPMVKFTPPFDTSALGQPAHKPVELVNWERPSYMAGRGNAANGLAAPGLVLARDQSQTALRNYGNPLIGRG